MTLAAYRISNLCMSSGLVHKEDFGSIKHLLQVRRQRSDCPISVAADLGLADCSPADAVDAPQCAKSSRQGSECLGEAVGIEEQRRLARQPRAAQRPDLAPDIAPWRGWTFS